MLLARGRRPSPGRHLAAGVCCTAADVTWIEGVRAIPSIVVGVCGHCRRTDRGRCRRGARRKPSPSKATKSEWVYRVKYGFIDEWWDLFRKYQIPILDRAKAKGYILDYRVFHPQLHGTRRGGALWADPRSRTLIGKPTAHEEIARSCSDSATREREAALGTHDDQEYAICRSIPRRGADLGAASLPHGRESQQTHVPGAVIHGLIRRDKSMAVACGCAVPWLRVAREHTARYLQLRGSEMPHAEAMHHERQPHGGTLVAARIRSGRADPGHRTRLTERPRSSTWRKRTNTSRTAARTKVNYSARGAEPSERSC